MARVILFTSNMAGMTRFYRDVLGLKPIEDAEYPTSVWIQFDAGGACLALHRAEKSSGHIPIPGENLPHKIAFLCDDIPEERKRLVKLGVAMGRCRKFGELELCDGSDPDGNRFQLTNR